MVTYYVRKPRMLWSFYYIVNYKAFFYKDTPLQREVYHLLGNVKLSFCDDLSEKNRDIKRKIYTLHSNIINVITCIKYYNINLYLTMYDIIVIFSFFSILSLQNKKKIASM